MLLVFIGSCYSVEASKINYESVVHFFFFIYFFLQLRSCAFLRETLITTLNGGVA